MRAARRGSLGPLGRLSQSANMDAACEVLKAAQLIRHVGLRAGGGPGRLSGTYEVNSAVLAANMVAR